MCLFWTGSTRCEGDVHTSEGSILTFVCNLVQAAAGSSVAQGSFREVFFSLLVVGMVFLVCWVFNVLGTDPLMFMRESRVEPGSSGCRADGLGGRFWNQHKTCGSG